MSRRSIEVSIIIVSYNVKAYLLDCIASIKKHSGKFSYEIIVVDNNSEDGSVEALERFPAEITIVENKENIGFAGANNIGFEKSSGEFILLLNPDTLITKGSVESVLDFMKCRSSAGVATCRVVNEDGSPQKNVHSFPTISGNIAEALLLDRLSPKYRNHYYYRAKPVMVDFIGGAFMCIRRSAVPTGPLLNPEYFMYAEEKDLSLRLRRAGFQTWFVPQAEIIHFGGRSTALMPVQMFLELQKSQVRFYRNNFPVVYSFALCLSWWMVLVCQTAVSLACFFSAGGRNRLSLFARAMVIYPSYVLASCAKRRRESALMQKDGL